jgi:hypothetical protein
LRGYRGLSELNQCLNDRIYDMQLRNSLIVFSPRFQSRALSDLHLAQSPKFWSLLVAESVDLPLKVCNVRICDPLVLSDRNCYNATLLNWLIDHCEGSARGRGRIWPRGVWALGDFHSIRICQYLAYLMLVGLCAPRAQGNLLLQHLW